MAKRDKTFEISNKSDKTRFAIDGGKKLTTRKLDLDEWKRAGCYCFQVGSEMVIWVFDVETTEEAQNMVERSKYNEGIA